MRFWLIDLPARIVDVWFSFYAFLILASATVGIMAALLMLVLAIFGIRWGW